MLPRSCPSSTFSTASSVAPGAAQSASENPPPKTPGSLWDAASYLGVKVTKEVASVVEVVGKQRVNVHARHDDCMQPFNGFSAIDLISLWVDAHVGGVDG